MTQAIIDVENAEKQRVANVKNELTSAGLDLNGVPADEISGDYAVWSRVNATSNGPVLHMT